jgi:hypothetical protein
MTSSLSFSIFVYFFFAFSNCFSIFLSFFKNFLGFFFLLFFSFPHEANTRTCAETEPDAKTLIERLDDSRLTCDHCHCSINTKEGKIEKYMIKMRSYVHLFNEMELLQMNCKLTQCDPMLYCWFDRIFIEIGFLVEHSQTNIIFTGK